MQMFPTVCENCNKLLDYEMGQSIVSGNIVWYYSCKCLICGFQLEQDGKEPTPDEIRDKIIAQNGEWGLKIEQHDINSKLLKVFRDMFNYSLEDVMKIKKSVPGIILTGTKVEIKRVQDLLRTNGCISSVVKIME